MIEKSVEIINKLGLHARASAKLVSAASRFGSHIEIEFGGQRADAKSIMAMMMLAAAKGSQVLIRTDGDDEQAAMSAIVGLINNHFDEDE